MLTLKVNPILLDAWQYLYSGDKLTEGRLRGVLEHKSRMWVVTGVSAYHHSIELMVQECVDQNDWSGKKKSYAQICKQQPFSYTGLAATLYGRTYVLTDICATLTPDECKPIPKFQDITVRPIVWPHYHSCVDCKQLVLCDERKPDGSGVICTSSQYRVCDRCAGKRIPLRHVLTQIKQRRVR